MIRTGFWSGFGSQWRRWLGAGLLGLGMLGSLGGWQALAQGDGEATSSSASFWSLTIDGAIGPAHADFFNRTLEDAIDAGAAGLILQLDTPGGLDAAMRDIIQPILSSPIPVITYVTPSGARAASAGTYILYASHVAAMAPATNLGAATPVQIGGMPELPDQQPTPGDGDGEEAEEKPSSQSQSAMEKKIVNDAVAYIRGLAELRGRNAEWAEQAVREGVSLSSSEALAQQVVDLVADNVDDLLAQLDGKTFSVEGGETTLNTGNANVEEQQPDWRSQLLAIITDPNVAYILMLVGIYGLIFEFSNPGLGGPGILGAICLLLALYAFSVLPVSYVGVALILVGVGLMVVEAFSPSFGVAGGGGLICFVIGSIVLMDTDLPAYQIALPVILAVAAASAGLLILILGMMLRATRQKVVSGTATLPGAEAHVEMLHDGQPLIRVQGELWQARCDTPLAVGDQVRITAVDNLTLTVEKITGA